MAQRRMFLLKVVDTDVFLSMPISSRCLYYDLAMRADDDGFIGSPKKIQRVVGCSDDDFRILLQKQYIIPFESGVCIVKDWNIHNYIRKDRYTKTIYSEEKRRLEIDENGRYFEKKEENKSVIPKAVPMVDTGQVRIKQQHWEIERNKISNIVVLCEKFNLSIGDVEIYIEKYGENYVKSKLLLLSVQKNVKNSMGWLKKALEGDWKTNEIVDKIASRECKKCNGTGYIAFIENLTNEMCKIKCDCYH